MGWLRGGDHGTISKEFNGRKKDPSGLPQINVPDLTFDLQTALFLSFLSSWPN